MGRSGLGNDRLECIVEDNPEELTACIDQIQQQLKSDELGIRRDAGRAIRVAAEHDPALIETHLETVVSLLSDRSGSVQLSGAIGLRELAAMSPTAVADTVSELLTLLKDTDAPAIQLAVIRALTHVGEHSPTAVAIADETVATLFQTATPPIRTAIVTIFAGVVVEDPSQFPEIICIMKKALDDESTRVCRYAAAALASIATTDRSAVSSVTSVRSQVEEVENQMTAQPWQSDETVKQAAETLRALDKPERT